MDPGTPWVLQSARVVFQRVARTASPGQPSLRPAFAVEALARLNSTGGTAPGNCCARPVGGACREPAPDADEGAGRRPRRSDPTPSSSAWLIPRRPTTLPDPSDASAPNPLHQRRTFSSFNNPPPGGSPARPFIHKDGRNPARVARFTRISQTRHHQYAPIHPPATRT